MIHVELPHVNVLSKIDLVEHYGKLGDWIFVMHEMLVILWSFVGQDTLLPLCISLLRSIDGYHCQPVRGKEGRPVISIQSKRIQNTKAIVKQWQL